MLTSVAVSGVEERIVAYLGKYVASVEEEEEDGVLTPSEVEEGPELVRLFWWVTNPWRGCSAPLS